MEIHVLGTTDFIEHLLPCILSLTLSLPSLSYSFSPPLSLFHELSHELSLHHHSWYLPGTLRVQVESYLSSPGLPCGCYFVRHSNKEAGKVSNVYTLSYIDKSEKVITRGRCTAERYRWRERVERERGGKVWSEGGGRWRGGELEGVIASVYNSR